jgi:hypothetical protein
MREFEIILFQTKSLKTSQKAVLFYKEHFKTFCEAFVDEFYLKLKLILRLKNSLIIQEENTKKNHKRVVLLYVINQRSQ